MLSLVVVLPQAASAKRHIVIEGIDSIPPMEFLDKYGNPSISVWNDASLAYIAELLEQEKDEKTVK